MISLNTTGSWNETAAKLKRRYSFLTDEDLRLIEGKEQELWTRLEHKLGKTSEGIRRLISKL
jgi:uncharacterized protein YjbJ (UPF0337 family)